MKRHLTDYFIPHQGNDHKPHIFREASVAMLAVLIVGVFGLTVFHSQVIRHSSHFLAAVLPSTLIDLTNDDRDDHDLPPLEYDATLERAAQLKANHMAEHGYFAHNSPDGTTPWEWFYDAGYRFTHAGENLAVNFSQSDSVEEAWMDSPGHRANILNENFTEIGIATARGEYEGEETVFVVQMFGTPSQYYEENTGGGADYELGAEGDASDSEVAMENGVNASEDDVADVGTSDGVPVQGSSSSDGVGETNEVQSPEENPFFDMRYAQNTSEEDSGNLKDNDSQEWVEDESDPTLAVAEQSPTPQQSTSSIDVATSVPDESTGEEFNENDQELGVVEEDKTVSLATTQTTQYPRWLARLVANPTFILEILYLIIGGMIIVSLGMMVNKEAHHHHPQGVFLGVALIALIVVLTYVSNELLLPTVIVT